MAAAIGPTHAERFHSMMSFLHQAARTADCENVQRGRAAAGQEGDIANRWSVLINAVNAGLEAACACPLWSPLAGIIEAAYGGGKAVFGAGFLLYDAKVGAALIFSGAKSAGLGLATMVPVLGNILNGAAAVKDMADVANTASDG
jgi:hypothetical protein